MKTLLIAIAVLFSAVSVKAQTCTPITVSYPDPAANDDGHGPGFGLSFNGTVYGSGTTVTVPPPQYGVYGVGAIGAQGYVNVRKGFGGCPADLSWGWEMETHSEVYDATLGKIVYGPTSVQTGSEQQCGTGAPAGSCHFDLWDNRWQNIPFVSGHTYYFYGWMEALWIPSPGHGYGNELSDQYEGYIKIVIE